MSVKLLAIKVVFQARAGFGDNGETEIRTFTKFFSNLFCHVDEIRDRVDDFCKDILVQGVRIRTKNGFHHWIPARNIEWVVSANDFCEIDREITREMEGEISSI